jgi:hypothetical protein
MRRTTSCRSTAPTDGDDLDRPRDLQLLSPEEADELTSLAIRTDSWVAYNLKAGRFQVIDMDAWLLLLDKRGH